VRHTASVQCTTSSTALMTTVQRCHLGVHSTALLTSATATATRSTAALCFLLTHCTGACPLRLPRPLPPGPLLFYVSYILTVQVCSLTWSARHGHQVHCCSMFLTYSLYRCLSTPLTSAMATTYGSAAAVCFLLTHCTGAWLLIAASELQLYVMCVLVITNTHTHPSSCQ